MHELRVCRRNHGGAGWDQWDTAGGGGEGCKRTTNTYAEIWRCREIALKS